MQYKFEYSIVNENTSKSKDDSNDMSFSDYPFTEENLEKVFSFLNTKSKTEEIKAEFIKGSMPQSEQIEAMVNDIVKYYEEEFAPDEMLDPEKKKNPEKLSIRIRFFMNKKSGGGESGDALGQEIRIFIKGFPDHCNRMFSYGTFAEKLESITYGRTLWFEHYLRYVLAHELFHIFHFIHYKKLNNKTIPDDHENLILMEVFAEYFATAYMHEYLHSEDPVNAQLKFNHIIDTGNAKWFGCGRKKLLPGLFDKDEIAADDKDWNDHCKTNPCLIENKKRNVSGADYAGGYVLRSMAERHNSGQNGRRMPEYLLAYNNMQSGKSDIALSELIRLKEKWWNEITG